MAAASESGMRSQQNDGKKTEFFSSAQNRRESGCFCQRLQAGLQDHWLQLCVCAPMCVILNWGSGR